MDKEKAHDRRPSVSEETQPDKQELLDKMRILPTAETRPEAPADKAVIADLFVPANGNVLARYIPPSKLRSGIILAETVESLPPIYEIVAVSLEAENAGYWAGQYAVLFPGRIPVKVPVKGEEFSVFLYQEILGLYSALEAAYG